MSFSGLLLYPASTVTGSAGLVNVSNMFDGGLTTSATVTASSDNYIQFTPVTGISYSSSVEVYCYAPNGYNITNTYSFNGGTETSFVGGGENFNGFAWITVASGSGTFNSVKIRLQRPPSAAAVAISAIRVDGTVLTQNVTNCNDIVPDSPTNNFATLNPLAILLGVTVSNGNLTNTTSTDNDRRNVFSSIAAPKNSGKFYAEFCVTTVGNSDDINVGVSSTVYTAYQNYMGGSADAYAYWGIGRKIHNNSYSTYGSAFSTAGAGGIIGVLIDTDNGDLTFYLNNSSMGTAYTGINFEEYFFGIGRAGDSVNVYQVNFGQDPTFRGNKNTPATVNINGTNVTGPFAPSGDAAGTAGLFYYPPPADALALCTANLPDFTLDVDDDTPQDYFKAVTYTGDGTTTKEVTIGFVPDLCWIKPRSWGNFNTWIDSVRGGNKHLYSDQTLAERNSPNSLDAILDFNSGGTNDKIKIGYESAWEFLNKTNETHVAWCWKAGGAAVTNNDGSITSTVSANTDAGFSIVTYTGTGANATWGHGLSSAPEMVIIKGRTNTAGWGVYHSALGPTKRLSLNTTDASETMGYFQNTSPTSTVFYITSNGGTGASGVNYIAYCWHSVEGYSKFGFVSNLNNDEYVYLGFRPSWVMLKRTSDTSNWAIYDNARNPYNVCDKILNADTPNSENTYASLDLLSNGFKARSLTGVSGGWIYMAFAEQPFKFSNAR